MKRIAIYDAKPGEGAWQAFLCLTWKIGCFIHKTFGYLDDYYGAKSWADAKRWLLAYPHSIKSLQYWGHGSPGTIWLAEEPKGAEFFAFLWQKIARDGILWFRVCSAFQGVQGHEFAAAVSRAVDCNVAGHTRIIGVLQGGLHVIKPGETPHWPVEEGELKTRLAYFGLEWGNNTVFALAANVPSKYLKR